MGDLWGRPSPLDILWVVQSNLLVSLALQKTLGGESANPSPLVRSGLLGTNNNLSP